MSRGLSSPGLCLAALLCAPACRSTPPGEDTDSGTGDTDDGDTDTDTGTDGGDTDTGTDSGSADTADTSTDSGSADSGDTDTGALIPDLPTASCNELSHEWVDLSDMGTLVEVGEAQSYGADSIEALLSAAGWTALLPVANDVVIWPIRYLTQDRGQVVEATGYVALPDLDAAQDVPLMLWLHPTMGFSDDCAPTAIGVAGAAYPILFASLGYAVAAHDYLGMAGWGEGSDQLHPYIVAEPTAVASLDAARAALKLAAEQGALASPDATQLVPYGASEGGFAAMWVDRYQPRYAPEFTELAVMAVVPITDLTRLATTAVSSLSSATAGMAGVLLAEQEWYGADVSPWMSDGLAEDMLAEMFEECSEFSTLAEVTQVTDVFTEAAVAALSSDDPSAIDPFACAMAESTVHEAPWPRESTAPVLIVTGEADELAWPGPVHDDIGVLCEQGTIIEHLQCADAGHVDAALDSLSAQIAWLQDRRDGVALGETCVVASPSECAL